MKAVWISKVFLLLSVVELEATSASESSCPKRNLTVTVNDQLRLYFDGIEITGLPNANIAYQPDVVDLPSTTRLIAIHGRNDPRREEAGIQGSTDDNYVLTNSSWKCSNVTHSGWEAIDFDDSSWISPVEFGHNGEWNGGISPNAERIWLRQWNGLKNSTYEEMDMDVYCRKRLDVDECRFGQPINECDPSIGKCISLSTGYNCSCHSGYQNDGQHKCKDINECLLGASENECDPSMGECIDTFGGYECRCYEGYANNGSKRCKDESGVGNVGQWNDDAARYTGTDPARYEYET